MKPGASPTLCPCWLFREESRRARLRLAAPGGSVTSRVLRDEEGKISLLTVIVVMMFWVLIGLVARSGQAVVEKLEAQNAADAAAYTTALWQARAMNAVTMTNHLLGELTAIVVVHEAFGGPTLEKGSPTHTDESNDMSDAVKDNADNAKISYNPTIGYLCKTLFDPIVLPQLKQQLGQKNDVAAGATIYDARLTLKCVATDLLSVKMAANAVGTIGEALKNVYGIGYILIAAADVLHLDATFELSKVVKEAYYLLAIQQAAKVFNQPKIMIRDVVIPMLSQYPDTAIGLGGATVNGAGVWRKSARTTLDTFESYYRFEHFDIQTFPSPDQLLIPVEPEAPPKSDSSSQGASGRSQDQDSSGRAPSFWGEHDRKTPLGGALGKFKHAVEPIAKFVEYLNKWEGGGYDVPSADIKWLGREPVRIEKIDGKEYQGNRGYGYPENPSLEDLTEIPWKAESTSQWVRATYPYVDSFREPIREWFRDGKNCQYSNASTYFANWTNRYTLEISHAIRSGKTSGGNSSSESQQQDNSPWGKLKAFRANIKEFHQRLKQAMQPETPLEQPAPGGRQELKEISRLLTTYVDGLDSDVLAALRQLTPLADQWLAAVRGHAGDVDTFVNNLQPPADLDMDETAFRELERDITLAATLDNLLRILDTLAAKIDQLVNPFSSKPHMYVMRFMPEDGKGQERWASSPQQADELFTVMGFAYRDTRNDTPFAPLFKGQHAKGRVAIAQAMIYNAGGLRPKPQGDKLQVDTGWDTLNWATPVKAREWGADPTGESVGNPWTIFSGSRGPNKNAYVRLNWQAKLVPVSEGRLQQAAQDGQLPANIKDTLSSIPAAPELLHH